MNQSNNNTEKPFTQSEVMLSFTDLFSCPESSLILKPVAQNSQTINQRYQQRLRNLKISFTIYRMIFLKMCFVTSISITDAKNRRWKYTDTLSAYRDTYADMNKELSDRYNFSHPKRHPSSRYILNSTLTRFP